ncbi:TRAP-type C4-dicarboxylate transport system, substrate-binding protein [Desulfatibacillum alkenivorans DSM 16219]|jgi:TRAP-type C4-dicarboxylate transport system substrate-binding protein|uniref:TRAP-type C4-dicarboxylate transport system, substrate-binding protein n=1 Tax=Desulfatibacillum alkenivorans DSM 16219 TaxID=1121393 RepID=A0A1M6UR34_9BACT|nr:TRAP transporter substrate-binding protein DctP [Desulfatibacillum alkenivorans]SHK71633.1 TRAP-type C4-dicarboxylate transport system, substrate-binding protein [Desulfatibacillum alkenivorans DSM 16219]
MKTKACFILVSLLIALSFAGSGLCSGPEGWSETYKVGTIAPKGIAWALQMDRIVFPEVAKATDGNLVIKVYWGGVMGDDEAIIKKMRIGQLHGAGMSGYGCTLAIPEMAVMQLPFLFSNWEEVDYVKEKMAPIFDEIARDHDYMVIAYIDQDFDVFFSSKYDMTKVEDFAQAKIISWSGPLEGEVLQAIGAHPIPVSMTEAPTSIRQGIGDTIIAPKAWAVGTQLYSILKYVSPLNIRYSPAVMLLTWDAYEQMPQDYRDRFMAVRPKIMRDFCLAAREDNDKCLNALIEYGIKQREMSPEEKAKLESMAHTVWEDQADQQYPAELLEQIQDHLEAFRSNK